MFLNPGTRSDLSGAGAALLAAFAGFSVVAYALNIAAPAGGVSFAVAAAVTAAGSALLVRSYAAVRFGPAIGLPVLAASGWLLTFFSFCHVLGYLRIPVDLLSFAETGFLTDIIEFRSGQPLFTPPQDNSAIVYTPGAPIVTYIVSRLLGGGNSIPHFRAVQFSFVVLAAVVATGIFRSLCRLILDRDERAHSVIWTAAAVPFLFLAAVDPVFNPYVHTLHNDGLALLLSVCAYWLVVQYAIRPSGWLVGAMCFLPALSFLVKQNQVMWTGIFLLFLLSSGVAPRKHILSYLLGCTLLATAAIGLCYWLWGRDFGWWAFTALGSKVPSPLRIAQHFIQSGPYLLFAAVAAWLLVFRNRSRPVLAVWLCWLVPFCLQLWTSGYAWQVNHLGPSVVIATCWFFVVLIKLWPQMTSADSKWVASAQQLFAALVIVAVLASPGGVRDPRDPVPADFQRYVSEINEEFAGLPPDEILADWGSWPYFEKNIVMKDRALSASVHAGENQLFINHDMLRDTIDRIRNKKYRKILARQVDTPESYYDFNGRGSGVTKALLENYRITRRIQAVKGVRFWWPMHLVQEVDVLVPKG